MGIIIILGMIALIYALYKGLFSYKGNNLAKYLPQSLNFKKKNTYIKTINTIPLNPKIVNPDNTPLYIKPGWIQDGNKYRGYYRTRFGAWKGEIAKKGDIFRVYIFNPPIKQLKHHPRWPCFHERNTRKWEIDLAKNPTDFDVNAVIFYVEKIIVESHKRQ